MVADGWAEPAVLQSGSGPHRAHSAGVVTLDVVPQERVAGISQRFEGRVALVRLHVAGLLPQVVKVEGQAVPRVKESSLAQVPVLGD